MAEGYGHAAAAAATRAATTAAAATTKAASAQVEEGCNSFRGGGGQVELGPKAVIDKWALLP